MKEIVSKIPARSIPLIQKWIHELDVIISLRKHRKTKLGDFRASQDKTEITINNDLNPFLFLITLTHEIAHAFVWKRYKRISLPHGNKWKSTFQILLLELIDLKIFPKDISEALKDHVKNPSASLSSDITLLKILRKYNLKNTIIVSSIEEGKSFKLANGKVFKKGRKLRKRFRCKEIKTDRIYLFHPLAEITPL